MLWVMRVTPSSADLKDPSVVSCRNSSSAGNHPDPKMLIPAELIPVLFQTSEAPSDEPSEGFRVLNKPAQPGWSLWCCCSLAQGPTHRLCLELPSLGCSCPKTEKTQIFETVLHTTCLLCCLLIPHSAVQKNIYNITFNPGCEVAKKTSVHFPGDEHASFPWSAPVPLLRGKFHYCSPSVETYDCKHALLTST